MVFDHQQIQVELKKEAIFQFEQELWFSIDVKYCKSLVSAQPLSVNSWISFFYVVLDHQQNIGLVGKWRICINLDRSYGFG